MKVKLPIIGLVTTGKDTEPTVVERPVETKKKGFLGGIFEFISESLSGEKSVSSKLLEAFNDWVYINISTLAEEVSKIEFQLFKTRLTGGQVELVEIEEHPILELLDKFNETTTKADAIYMTEAHIDLTGDTFYLKQRGKNGEIENLFVLRPDKMSLVLGDFTDASARLIEGYKYEDVVDGDKIEITYDPGDIIHIKTPNPKNPYRGKSVVESIALTLDTNAHATEATKNFFKNGMIANFGLFTEQRLTDEQIKNMEAQLRSKRSGSRNAFKIPIFSGGIKPETLQMSNKEVQLIDLQEWLSKKIMAAFKNTKASLGITDDVNRANAEATLLNWKRSVIAPKMARIVDALNEYLVPEYGDNLILGFKDPVPEDRTRIVEEIEKLYVKAVNPVFTEDEVRGMLGLDAMQDSERSTKVIHPTLLKKVSALKYVDINKIFRKQKLYTKFIAHKELYGAAKTAAKGIVAKRHSKEIDNTPKPTSPKRAINFWKRLVDIVERLEAVFDHRLQSFITDIAEEAQSKLDDDKARKDGKLFDRERRMLQAEAEFAPILTEAAVLGGQEAHRLMKINQPYVPRSVKNFELDKEIKAQIALFSSSMLDTDQEVLAGIIADGLKAGEGIPVIRRQIQEKFEQFSKTQAERITRTEVMTAANKGVLDSFAQSEVVVAKQWLTAGDPCAYCAPMQGQILPVEDAFFSQGDEWLGNAESPLKIDYRSIEAPPLHPNCRCTLIDVIEGVAPVIEPKGIVDLKLISEKRKLAEKVSELEQKIDKRTKAYRSIKQKKLDQDDYVKELEALVYEQKDSRS